MTEIWEIHRDLWVCAFIRFLMQLLWISYLTNSKNIDLDLHRDSPNELETLKEEYVLVSPQYHVGVITEPTNRSSFWCGGTLISKNHVLTAAHCLERSDYATIIFTGIKNTTENNNKCILKSSKFKKHPKWQPRLLLYDLALIELPQPPDFPDLNPINISSNVNITGKLAIVYGWEDHTTKPVLKKKEVTVIRNKDCSKHYRHFITKYTVCTKGIRNGCHGFSGSGLVIDDFLIGVLSFGTDPCNSSYPTVYTRVSRYRKWIQKNVED